MNSPKQPLLSNAKEAIGSLAADLQEMARLRWQLAQLELAASARQIRWLVIGLLIAGVVVLSSLPLLIVAAADALAGTAGISFAGWLLILALGLLVGGIAGGWLVWRCFRRRFVGLEQTLEELREDAVWLQEWVGREEDS
jgi:hypothetical protein